MSEEASEQGPGLSPLGWRDVTKSVAGLVLVVLLIAFGLPRILRTTWSEIGAQLARVEPGHALAMAGLLIAGLFCYTWVVRGSLPGVSHLQALKVNAVASLVSNVMPLGAAVGAALSFVMLRSWGFASREISSSMLVTALWNLLARIALPVVGCLILVAGPVDAPAIVVRAALIAGAVGTGLIVLAALMIFSDSVAAGVVRAVETVAGWVGRGDRLRRVDHLVTDQRRRVETLVRRGGVEMTLGMAGMFVLLFGLYWFAARAVGLDLPVAELIAAYTFRQLLTALAVTPGGLGVTEVGTAGLLVLFGGSPGAASATALLYAVYAHLVVVPFGVAALAAWRVGMHRRAGAAEARG
ncbi:lysylphosphatidylglycerol synthase transmembrane domain-containing protein [Ornithinimicrobium tianjinense]|uniref:Membrane protein n=1 Tax=Ornithinimicrobium tianjinense TaxID=1195761 RepID=A0A917BM94_9MICO|nr:lysylphosphatidylglycerol synthase transmembrane domain-containing protein [Ornithinimicrobium tianjinense]GGF51675.1 membrane protein [Ornithinimicrobium tianjinense]